MPGMLGSRTCRKTYGWGPDITSELDRATAMPPTLSGLRVFMPKHAFQAGTPLEERRYLGRWMKEDTVDIYTRAETLQS